MVWRDRLRYQHDRNYSSSNGRQCFCGLGDYKGSYRYDLQGNLSLSRRHVNLSIPSCTLPPDLIMASEFVDEMMSFVEMDILRGGFAGGERELGAIFGF